MWLMTFLVKPLVTRNAVDKLIVFQRCNVLFMTTITVRVRVRLRVRLRVRVRVCGIVSERVS